MTSIEEAISVLKAAGYRVSKPRTKHQEPLGLNAVGKPYSEQYDPNWKRKHPLTSINRLYAPMPPDVRWVQS